MRYGSPSIAEKVQGLQDQGCNWILLLPLYLQYSAATTTSVMDKAFDVLKRMRHQPTFRAVPPYYDHPGYIKATATGIRQHHPSLDWKPDVTIASLHGLPQAFID